MAVRSRVPGRILTVLTRVVVRVMVIPTFVVMNPEVVNWSQNPSVLKSVNPDDSADSALIPRRRLECACL